MHGRRELATQTRGEFASVTAARLVFVICAGLLKLTTPKGWRCSPPRGVGDAHHPVGLEMLTTPWGWRCSLPRGVGDAHHPVGLEMLTTPWGWRCSLARAPNWRRVAADAHGAGMRKRSRRPSLHWQRVRLAKRHTRLRCWLAERRTCTYIYGALPLTA